MGCASSKTGHNKSRCKHCKQSSGDYYGAAGAGARSSSYSSMFVQYHPPSKKGDSYHVVALTSTTLGSLHLDHRSSSANSPCRNPILPHFASFNSRLEEKEKEKKEDGSVSMKKAEFEVGMMEAKAWSKMIDEKMKSTPPIPSPSPGEPETINAWEMMEGLEEELQLHAAADDDGEESTSNEAVVLYLTSLRGIRKTYEDCCDVKLIFKGLRVRVDERDVSMHSAFKDELRDLLAAAAAGDHEQSSSSHLGLGLGLPRVFLGDKYIGGADEIRRMHEEGALHNLLQRCSYYSGLFIIQQQHHRHLAAAAAAGCDACGDVRFVPCQTCSGSCKIYYQLHQQEDDEFGFQRCPDCNENGLIRCPICRPPYLHSLT